jgi:hypothetical protein
MREVRTEITIDAPVHRVFQILIDIQRYHEWNPLIVSGRGRVEPGEKLDIAIRLPGKPDIPYVVHILRVVNGREFVWIGHMKMKGILDGMHFFELFPEGANRVRVVQREEFRGLLVPLVWKSFLDTRMREGFEAVNRNLKELAER